MGRMKKLILLAFSLLSLESIAKETEMLKLAHGSYTAITIQN
jgi:hypothetical protein